MTAKCYIPAGTVFNRLTFLHDVENPLRNGRLASFRCECGAEKVFYISNVKSGKSASCGCFSKELTSIRSTTHGRSKSSIYRTWHHMIERCENVQDKRYGRYGGRGISVCDRWRNSFDNFLLDMGERPAGMTLDRKDNNGNYELSNCRWATPTEQANNRKTSLKIEYKGKLHTVNELSKMFDISYFSMRFRVVKSKMSHDQIFSSEKIKTTVIENNGIKMTLAEWSLKTGIAAHTIATRLRRGKTVEEALACK